MWYNNIHFFYLLIYDIRENHTQYTWEGSYNLTIYNWGPEPRTSRKKLVYTYIIKQNGWKELLTVAFSMN